MRRADPSTAAPESRPARPIGIIGAGYVGLVTAACLAELGHPVLCIDVDATKVEALTHGAMPIFEPRLEPMVRRNREAGRLRFSTAVADAVACTDLLFIAVDTPPEADGSADVDHVLAVAREIGRHLRRFTVVVDKSTVPVGTAEAVRAVIAAQLRTRGVDVGFAVVSNPEFLREGCAVADFLHPDRIVVGTDDARALRLMRELYQPFIERDGQFLAMDLHSAELTKYAANAMLAARISFMNEMALLAEKVGADIEQVRLGIGSDPRIGPQFLRAGCGYGGSCFPKDVQALLATAHLVGEPMHVVAAVERANALQKRVLVDRVVGHFGADLRGRRFALWGLAFKPDTDDIREAPSRVIAAELGARGATVTAHDPRAMPVARRVLAGVPGLQFAPTALDALDGADALLLVTDWAAYRTADLAQMRRRMRTPLVFDGRNLFDPDTMREAGFDHRPIGRAAPARRTDAGRPPAAATAGPARARADVAASTAPAS